jgi:hypothetical protein
MQRCVLPGWENNDTYEIQNEYHFNLVELYIVPPKDAFSGKYDGCQRKNYSRSNGDLNYTLDSCTQWVYSKEYFGESMVTKVRLYKFNFLYSFKKVFK